jgi:hypothetical protein
MYDHAKKESWAAALRRAQVWVALLAMPIIQLLMLKLPANWHSLPRVRNLGAYVFSRTPLDTFRTVVHKRLTAGFQSPLLFSSFCAPDGWVLFVLGVFKVLFRFGPSLLTGWGDRKNLPHTSQYSVLGPG